MTDKKTVNHTIDATGKSIGRVASSAAYFLRGKGETGFKPHLSSSTTVTVTNVSKVKILPSKFSATEYRRYSGYPGGLKSETMAELVARLGYPELFRRMVKGMLPKNKLQRFALKRLIVTD